MPTDDQRHERRRSPPQRPHRSRSRSPAPRPNRHHHPRRDREGGRSSPKDSKKRHKSTVSLPFRAPLLTKDDYAVYKHLFAQYLDLQKQISLSDLTHDEARGRWKSFLKKWNRGELAEGWYDPEILQRSNVRSAAASRGHRDREPAAAPSPDHSSSDDGPGPYMDRASERGERLGPAIPSMQDLALKREQEAEDAGEARAEMRRDRRANRAAEKERLEELAPRAMAGTRERQLEKRNEQAAANRAFAEAKAGGDMPEVNDADLMGDDGGVSSYKQHLQEMERKKSERQIRREETVRARQEERQQRAREIQEREARTMEGLIELAKQRYG